MNKQLIKSIKRDRSLPSYLRYDLATLLKSRLYNDTCTIISTLDKSPRSMACVYRFKKLDPFQVRTKQGFIDFKNELTNIRDEALRCTINPYFFIPTRTNNFVRTIGDINIPNSREVLSINDIVKSHKYDYLDKPKIAKNEINNPTKLRI